MGLTNADSAIVNEIPPASSITPRHGQIPAHIFCWDICIGQRFPLAVNGMVFDKPYELGTTAHCIILTSHHHPYRPTRLGNETSKKTGRIAVFIANHFKSLQIIGKVQGGFAAWRVWIVCN